MYYLTYRPTTIEEIDNSAPREIIKKILLGKSLPHAFLYVGQKGTGKTSMARIFAKSLNCLSKKSTPSQIDPCNTCAHCKSIDKDSFPDVIEMDAASNRGINEIKTLIKESSFMPIAGKYRVFIIDEAHMITTDGFNALLKTLEEPPSTVIFILATTNGEKIPKTIASRCMSVVFGKAKPEEILHMLHRILTREKLQIDKKILELISTHCDHSFRDAAKLLEELVIQKKLTFETAQAYLGVQAKENLLKILSVSPCTAALQWIEEFSQTGGSFKNLIEELLSQLHLILLSKYKIGTTSDISMNLTEVTSLMKLLNEAYLNLKYSPIESIPLEIAIVEFYNKRSK